jgi:hypothetical protein
MIMPEVTEEKPRPSIEKRRSRSSDDPEVTTTSVTDEYGDEALQLVGKERQFQFSDEYNAKLRRKLVSWGYLRFSIGHLKHS